MNSPLTYGALAVFAVGACVLAPVPASAMPAANIAAQLTPAVDPVHAVRVCNRWGRCWWTYAGGFHRHYGYGGWNRGWGWRHGYRRWR